MTDEVKKEDEETVITFGDEEAPASKEEPAPAWVKDLRTNQKRLTKENREMKAALEAKSETDTLGTKPTLEACEHDSKKYEEQLDAWHEKKSGIDQKKKVVEADQKRQDDAWRSQLEKHKEKITALGISDYDETEDIAREALTVTQQGIVLQGADNSAAVNYALGKRPEKLKELAAIKDPIKFATAMSKFEGQLKVKKRTAAAAPEEKLESSGAPSPKSNDKLEKMLEKARKTGEYGDVIAYKKLLRAEK